MYLGIDVGSTTVKLVLFDKDYQIIYKKYQRHLSEVRKTTIELLDSVNQFINKEEKLNVCLTGSAGLGLSKDCDLPFVQEVYATQLIVNKKIPDCDVVIELGGEDAKIIFLTNGFEFRMNGSCAGGTGAFIDQMATLLNVSMEELDKLSLAHNKIYTIASRCGVFAKSDIQPLLNQGARKENIAASIYQAVVDQTVAGLSQGRIIEGKVVFLGGPLTFFKGLRDRFVISLTLDEDKAIFPEDAQYYVAMGAAMYAANEDAMLFDQLMENIRNKVSDNKLTNTFNPLFANKENYDEFLARHQKTKVKRESLHNYSGNAYLGIDAGSTTTKLVLLSEDDKILYEYYTSNHGNPVLVIKEQLQKLLSEKNDKTIIKASTVTGYGEDIIKTAFSIDFGLVETFAHYLAAKHFNDKVDFILDIGGQDIKCFRIRNNSVDSVILNEACSSGCGSFIETYAKALGHEVKDFAKKAIYAKQPIDLGSRCTVFMNSSIKQAQKEGAAIEDISAGLSMSVIKNALYKVIRANSADDLGKEIVVQGGTFLNDGILRSFELEINRKVVRPEIAGLMGAYGAALYAKANCPKQGQLISLEKLSSFIHTTSNTTCGLCTNKCSLTINEFDNGKKYISGNRCERPYDNTSEKLHPNLFKEKSRYLRKLVPKKGSRGKIGIPFGLNMYENHPFWYGFLTSLGFEAIISGISNRQLYTKGQHTIPSDTVCYPAKLMHGHIEKLIDKGIKEIFYPCMTYNFDENIGDNNYNCPVVAYYPELLYANIHRLKEVNYHMPYFGIHRRKDFEKKAFEYFSLKFNVTKKEIMIASKNAYAAYEKYKQFILSQGEKAIAYARKNNLQIIVLAGRPYHIDPEINHGIDDLLITYDCVVITEDCISHHIKKQSLGILNQWTYHSRMYNAATYVTTQEDMEMIQLVSFGCGTDAITTDEIREILEKGNKFYTQIKIDEINNLGAAKIRIRSLLAAIENKRSKRG
ncbi:MAG: 2-hydroxyacyl-CoA dehydratase [Clostridiales bacterium]|nr:2-hydroxyacyl-CoA dehydratase [Clostridiales bacterium]